MSKIYIENRLPESVTVRYKSSDNQNISQAVGSNSLKQTNKDIDLNSTVTISNSNQSQSITYEAGYRTLEVYHNSNKLTLQWI